MSLFGLTISDIVGILTIIGILIGVVGWFFKKSIQVIDSKLITPLKVDFIQPLKNSLDNLATKLDGMEHRADEEHGEFRSQLGEHDNRLDGHDLKLTEHEQKIKTLFHNRGGKADE